MTATNDRRASTLAESLAPVKPKSRWQHLYSRSLIGTDTIAVVLALGLAQGIRFGGFGDKTYFWLSVTLAVAWLASLSIYRSRSERIIGAGSEEYRRVWLATISVFGYVAIISMLFKLEIARGYLMIALPVGSVFLLLLRWGARRLVVTARDKYDACITRVVVVGSSPAVRDLATALARDPKLGYRVVGACVAGPSDEKAIAVSGLPSIPILGDVTQAAVAAKLTNSHAVAITACEHLDSGRIRDLSWELEKADVDLLVAPGVVDVAGPRLHLRPVAGFPLIHVEKPQYDGAKRFQKRLFDLVFSSMVLMVGSPLLFLISIAVKLDSKGPVLYRQERVGLNGNVFHVIKFRTMVVGAEAMTQDLSKLNLVASPRDPFKFVDDPRVTVTGRFLRKYSLDELPQFINVLKHDMSVVGPRPQVRREVETYDDDTKRRLLVRPGITGLWQVSGRSDLSWEDSVRLDLFYVENWSMITDLMITLQTLKVLVRPSGGY
jgi:exopolysaccharide biosynthesis polyprenyl glycosylphosphotransferase